MSKRTSIKSSSPLTEFVSKPKGGSSSNQQDDMSTSQQADISTNELERATYYLSAEQKLAIDELVLKLKRQRVKTNKSELVRLAVDMLADLPVDEIAEKIQS